MATCMILIHCNAWFAIGCVVNIAEDVLSLHGLFFNLAGP